MGTPILATKTVKAIEDAIAADQGSSYRKHLRHLMPQAEDAYRETDSPFRSHLGASLIGRKCDRELWYSWRWTHRKSFPGRILRLFNRGHLEEPRFMAALLAIGCTIWQFDQNGNQFRVSAVDGHFGGSLDGVVIGIPDLPAGTPVLAEFKTHNDSSFSNLQAAGVHKAKLEHYVQMQIYMWYYKLQYAIYLAVNKNNDEIYAEIIPFDQACATRYLQRANTLIKAVDIPAKLPHSSAGWYECRFCDAKGLCHGKDTPERNCRTCRWSRAGGGGDGAWYCWHPETQAAYGEDALLSKEDQLAGCSSYEIHEALK